MEDLAETTRRRRWLKERASALRKKIRTRFVLKRMERHAMDEYRTRTSVRRVSNAPFIQPPWADEVQWASARIEVVRLERAARDMVSFAIRGSGAGIDRLLRNAAILLACRPLDLPSEAHPLVKVCARPRAYFHLSSYSLCSGLCKYSCACAGRTLLCGSDDGRIKSVATICPVSRHPVCAARAERR